MRALTLVSIAALAAACSNSPAEGGASPIVITKEGGPEHKLIGAFNVQVTYPTPGVPVMTVRPLRRDEFVVVDGFGKVSSALTNETSQVTLTSSGSAWDGTNHKLTSRAYIQNNSTSKYLDEPFMTISGITIKDAGSVTVVENASQAAIAAGKTFSGSSYYFADMTYGASTILDAASKHKNYASQYIQFNDTTGAPFDFTATVWANETTTATGILVDFDEDTWNTEPFAGFAGGDCNDSTAGTPLSSCGGSCDSACTSCSAGCCADVNTGGVNCSSGCTCSSTPGSNADTTLVCTAGSNCTLNAHNGDKVYGVTCGNGATCTVKCATSNDQCWVRVAAGNTATASVNNCSSVSTCTAGGFNYTYCATFSKPSGC